MTLLRIKVIEKGDGYKIVEFPFWASEPMLQKVAENLRKDAAIEGRELRITIGHRLVRVEGDVR